MITEMLYLVLVTLVPGIELRGSIPLGLVLGLSWPVVFVVAVLTNIVLGPLVYLFLYFFLDLLRGIKHFDRAYSRLASRKNARIRPVIDRHGSWALSLFIGMPWPGTGSYTGALVALLLGIKLERFALINAVGNIIAGTLVLLASLGVIEALRFIL